MAIYKCKMCGGELDVQGNISVIECDFCGTKQTVPTANDEKVQTLFNRANTLRLKSEFDKSAEIYEKILEIDERQAEAYWGLILCKFGIEYVEDPKTFTRVPTCHRTSIESITADDDYKSALQYADGVQREIYENEAKEIDRLQKEILKLSQKEDPYDVFICYKETDDFGKRTEDSVIANDIYYQLTNQGFKVFYAAITLEGKLGSAYEPCIFAALNSSKVMLAVGTKPEYFNAVWVKNEWSRFLKMMKDDKSKTLIPCYKNMDAYELPEEFSHLQAQDMGKIGFVNDIIRGISKVLGLDSVSNSSSASETGDPTISSLLERAFMFLEDGDWEKADDYCEKVLDRDPQNASAYLGKMMADLKVTNRSVLANLSEPFTSNSNYIKFIRFAGSELKAEIEEYSNKVQATFNESKASAAYSEAMAILSKAKTKADFFAVAEKFKELGTYKDAVKLYDDCILRGKNAIYSKAKQIIDRAATEAEIDKAIRLLSSIPDYLDSSELAGTCKGEWKKCLDRYTALVANYKALSQKASGVSREQQIKNEINKLSSEKSRLERLATSFPNDSRELNSTETEINSKKEEISALQTERASLGIFARKRKKEIDGNVYVLQRDIDTLNSKAAQLKNALYGYSSADVINSKITSIEGQTAKLYAKLTEVETNAAQFGSIDDVINELLSDNIFKFVLKNLSVLSESLKNSAALKSVMNNTARISKFYSFKLPQNIIDELEGTDDEFYYIHKNDRRTETQIVADLEKYYSDALFADYEIARNVEPTYFGAHPKCKPIQFLFKKDGKDVLAVTVCNYSSATHAAVTNVKEACKKHQIPYIRFIVGYPNKEHYVVRRTLEELGEIDYFYADYSWQKAPLKYLQSQLTSPYTCDSTREELKERIEFRKKYKINL